MIISPAMDIALSEDGKYLIYVTVDYGSRKTVYSALDVGYTLAAEYRDVLIGPETRIIPRFPSTTLHFQYDGDYSEKNIKDFLTRMNIPFYFDANGLFLYKDSADPDPTAAAWSFLEYAISGDVIHGPDYTMLDIDAVELATLSLDSTAKRLFVYHE